MWYYSGYLLSFVVPQDERKLVLLAQTYLRYISFGAPGYIFFETGKRFLQAQHIFTAGQYSLFIVAPINVILNYLLVWDSRIGLGFIGAPISTAISYWLMSFILLGYATFIDGKECWFGLKMKESFNFREWGSMMSLALNGTAMLLSEFIAFEVLTLSASRFGTSSLAAQSITSTFATLSFQIPFAVSVAVSTQMANYIGAQNLKSAKTTLYVAKIFAFGLGLVNCVVLVVFGKQIATSFTDDVVVTDLAVVALRVLGINQLYDCPNILFAGCLRGQGRQQVGSILNLLAYYVIAVPLALILGFRFQFGLLGLWCGLGVGIFTLAGSEYWFLRNSNWDTILFASRLRNFNH
jgi:MATE family multidrug resistance protein